MLRRQRGLGLVLTAVVLACFLVFGPSVSAQNYGSVAELNTRLQGAEIKAEDTVGLVINVDPYSVAAPGNQASWPRYVIANETPITGEGNGVNYSLSVRKQGAGTWRLGGASSYFAGTSNTFNVQAGTYEMMRNATLTIRGGLDAANQSFNLGPGTTLNARGVNVITASTIVVGDNTTFGFDLTCDTSSSPILTLDGNFNTVQSGAPATGALNLLGFKTQGGTGDGIIQLLQYTYTGTTPAPDANPAYPAPPIRAVDNAAGGDAYNTNYDLYVRGERWEDVVGAGGRLGGTVDQVVTGLTATGGTTTIRLTNFFSRVGEVTWTGNNNQNWNATSGNWAGAGNTFLHGDTVTFTEAGQGTVTIQEGGVQIGEDYSRANGTRAYGMSVTGGKYVFQNALDGQGRFSIIGIDGGGSVHISSESGDTTNPTEVLFRSANLYWGGTTIESNAHVTLENSAALGTGMVTLNGGGKLIFDTTPEFDVFHNQINGTGVGEIVKLGDNTVRINGGIATDSNTTVQEGVLQKGIGYGVLTVYADATYEAFDENRLIAGLSDGPRIQPGNLLNGGTVNLNNQIGGTPLVLTITTTSSSYKFSGYITGAGAAINKEGSRNQTFSGQNDYSGGTNINAGTLIGERVLADDETELDITPFGSGAIRVGANGTLQFSVGQVSSVSPPTHVAVIANRITGSGKVVKTGVDPDAYTGARYGDVILCLTSNNSDYTGMTDVVEGYLRITSINATGKTSEVRLYGERSVVDPINPSQQRQLAATALQFKAPVDGGTLGSATDPYDRAVRGEGNVEVLDGTTIYVSGFNTNDAGVLQESDYTGKTSVLENANLILTDPRGTGKTGKVDLTTDSSILTLYFSGEDEQVYDRYISGLGDLVKDGGGVAVLDYSTDSTGMNDFQGTTTVQDGTLKLLYERGTGVNDPALEHAVTVNAGAFLELAFSGDYKKSIGGTGALVKSGEGTTTVLEGFNTYSGGTYLYSGTLSFSSMDETLGGNLGTGGIYFRRGGGILQNTARIDELKQDVFIDAGSTATFDTQKDLAIGRDYTIWHTDTTQSGEKSNFLKTGGGNMTIDADVGPDTPRAGWTGTTTVQEGWLRNNIPTNTVLIVYQGGENSVGYYTGSADRRLAALWGDTNTTGGEVNTVAGYDLIIDYTDRDKADTFAGSITGGGNLVLNGNGGYETIEVEIDGETVRTTVLKPTTLILTGNNSYTGTTTVQGSYGVLVGNIANNTRLTVGDTGTYRSGGSNRFIASLEGAGTVDMQKKNLYINQTDTGFNPNFTGVIENGWDLFKEGAGTQIFGGLKYSFGNDVQIRRGKLVLGSGYAVVSNIDIGNNLSVAENVRNPETGLLEQTVLQVNANTKINVGKKLDIRGTLDMHVGNSLISADSVALGNDSILNVSGIGSNDEQIVIIHSNTAINDDFGTVTVAGSSSTVDFLTLSVDKSADKRDILVGQMLRWYAPQDAHGTFTLEKVEASYTVGRPLNDVTGTFDPDAPEPWDGKTLTKRGPGTLVLATENGYTGPTLVEGGTLKLTHEKATSGSSEIVLSGGTLELDFNSRNADGTWTEGLTTSISGVGGVRKTGHGTVSVLGGINTYTGRTDVQQGALLVDGSIDSHVWVASKAAFGGNGVVNDSVTFDDGSFLYWRFGETEAESDLLQVAGNIKVGDNVRVRPVTSLLNELAPTIDGWKILKYDGALSNEFAGVDASSNPFYNFELDHSEPGYVKISGNRLDTPRALSDVVATSAVMAQTKMHRSAFRQIGREWLSDCPVALEEIRNRKRQEASRGQTPGFYRTSWANFVGRGGHYGSSYFNDDYNFQSYGVQAGVSLYSSCSRTFGLMFGREEAKLSNRSDRVENEDYYLGLYFGRIFANRYDMLMYVGGGWQKNDLVRQSNGRGYGARYNGSTFNYNLEFGRRFFTEAGNTVRPYVGLDVEIVRLGSGEEKTLEGMVSNEYRHYGSSNLNQVFFKIGIEGNRNWKLVDFHGGANINWNVGDSRPETRIYYPAADTSVIGYGEDLGTFGCSLNVGMNWYITERRNTMFFFDYTADLYLDRHGSTDGHSGWTGFSWRF